MEHRVYVPAPDHPAVADIAPGSGVVGRAQGAMVLADFEGNLHGADNIRTLADRLHHAAGRAATRYPTVARRLVPAEALLAVGWYDEQSGRLVPDDAEAEAHLAGWLGRQALDPDELETTGAFHEHRRAVSAATASPDPAMRWWAGREAARLGIDGRGR